MLLALFSRHWKIGASDICDVSDNAINQCLEGTEVIVGAYLMLIHVERAIDFNLNDMAVPRRAAIVLGDESSGKWGIPSNAQAG